MKKRTTRLTVTLLLGTGLLAAAAALAADGVLWVGQADGFGENDMAHAIATGDNVVVAAGYFGRPSGFDDAVAAGYSPSGTLLWTVVEIGAFGEDDIFFDAGYDNVGRSFYVFGYTTTDNQGNTQGFLIKLAADGTVLWRRTFLPPGYRRMEWNPAMAVRDGKAFIAATVTRDLPGGGEDQDIYVASLGPDNTVNWERTADPYGGRDDHAAVRATSDGLVVLGTVSNSVDNNAVLVRQYAYADGAVRWSALLSEPGPGGVAGVRNVAGGLAVSGGTVFVTAATNAPGTDDRQAIIASLDSASGTERWRLPIESPSPEATARLGTLVAAGGGSVFVSGTRPVDPDNVDIFVTAVRDDNTAGTLRWDRTFRGPNTNNYVPGFLAYDENASRLLLAAALPPAGSGVPRMSLRAFRQDTGADAGSVVVGGGGAGQGDRVDAGAMDGSGGVYIAGHLETNQTADDLAVARIGIVSPSPAVGGGGGGACMAVTNENRSSIGSPGGWLMLFTPILVLFVRKIRRGHLRKRL